LQPNDRHFFFSVCSPEKIAFPARGDLAARQGRGRGAVTPVSGGVIRLNSRRYSSSFSLATAAALVPRITRSNTIELGLLVGV
jgi:hypothetical protein